ncbi:MAG: hypothetical protein WKF47_08540 [Geodermatophilaceae bacterium]
MTTQLAVLPPVSLGRIRRAGWVRVTYGVHRPLGLAGERLADLASWQQVLPNSGTFTHLTGAMVRGWWLPPLPAELPVFAGIMDSEPRPRRPGLVVCRHTQRIDWDPVAGCGSPRHRRSCWPPLVTSACSTSSSSPTLR